MTFKPRTDEEILRKIKSLAEPGSRDWAGHTRGDLMEYLPFEAAKPHLREGATAEDWAKGPYPLPRDEAAIVDQIKDYMDFAWEKANDCRGLSAGRSLDHMHAWLWMLGEDLAAAQLADYNSYGKDKLAAICEHFGWDWKKWDDGEWKDSEQDAGSPAPAEIQSLTWNAPATTATPSSSASSSPQEDSIAP